MEIIPNSLPSKSLLEYAKEMSINTKVGDQIIFNESDLPYFMPAKMRATVQYASKRFGGKFKSKIVDNLLVFWRVAD